MGNLPSDSLDGSFDVSAYTVHEERTLANVVLSVKSKSQEITH